MLLGPLVPSVHVVVSPVREMELAMVHPAKRDRELVAHSTSECTRLSKGEVMRIRRHAAAYQARLPQHELPVVFIAQANRLA